MLIEADNELSFTRNFMTRQGPRRAHLPHSWRTVATSAPYALILSSIY